MIKSALVNYFVKLVSAHWSRQNKMEDSSRIYTNIVIVHAYTSGFNSIEVLHRKK